MTRSALHHDAQAVANAQQPVIVPMDIDAPVVTRR
jgi:hypothetical protein